MRDDKRYNKRQKNNRQRQANSKDKHSYSPNETNINERRLKSRRSENKKKRLFYIVAIILMIVAIYIISSNLFSRANTNDSENIDQNNQTTEALKTEERMKKIQTTLAGANDDLISRLDEYISSASIKGETVQVAYYNMKEDKLVKYNQGSAIPMRNYNFFLLSMLAEDLDREGKLDLNKSIDLSNYQDEEAQEISDETDNEVQIKSLANTLEMLMLSPSDQNYQAVLDVINPIVNNNWIEYANSKYGLNITENNEMTIDDIVKSMRLLLAKDENLYIYRHTISNMMDSAQSKDSLFTINNKYFIGVSGTVQYAYTIENAFILGDEQYLYTIYSQSSEISVLNNLRQIIIDWHEDYH